ncbi:MAG: PmoA family protein [Phycisphaerae bacterium]|nr:PmoA family protein [Phycisphaerae bacterium]
MKSRRKFMGAILVIGLVFGLAGASEAQEIRLRVSGSKVDCVDIPVHTVIDLPGSLANVPVEEIAVSLRQISRGTARIYGMPIPGQIVMGSDKKAELWWVMPRAEAGSTNSWTATLKRREKEDEDTFSWKDTEGEYMDLLFGGRKVTRYMYALDRSTKQRVLETYKTFLHVFDAAGENLLTNGPDGLHPYMTNKILYPHHRGIFIGWNKLEFGGKRYDFWHMGEQGRVQKAEKFLELTAGPVLAKSNSLVHWNDKDGQTIIAEQRKTTVFRQSEPTILLLEFVTELNAVNGDVLLDGDPEHAGFQYRPHDDVAKGDKDVKATYLFHKDGINPKKDEDLPWAGMSYGLNGKRYSVLYMDCPDNPKPVVYSAYRDYGRFGAFFKKKIGAGETLTLRYRIWITEGPMPERVKLAKKYSEFVDGPTVEVVK